MRADVTLREVQRDIPREPGPRSAEMHVRQCPFCGPNEILTGDACVIGEA